MTTGPSSRPGCRVFISSTYLDNEDRRKVVEDAVLRAEMLPVAMERFTASAQPTKEECLRMAAEADVFVGIVAWRYGWVPPGEIKSISELEYDAAKQASVPCLLFQLNDSVPVDPRSDFDVGPDRWVKQQKLDAFEARIAAQMVGRFDDTTLGTMTLQALLKWQRQRTHSDTRPEPTNTPPTPFTDQLATYLRQVESKHATVSLAGFETRVRVPIRLDDLHIPLRATVDLGVDERPHAREPDAAMPGHRGEREIPLAEAFAAADRYGNRRAVVVLGDPGSGKTTHLRRVALALSSEGPASMGLPEGTIPVILPLRLLDDTSQGLDAFINDQLKGPFQNLPEAFACELIHRGKLLFLLDGLDEVADASARAEVSRWIEQAVEAYPDCRFLVTCRYAGYTGHARLNVDFLELHLRPLDTDQAHDFVHNWYRIVETSMADDKLAAELKAKTQADELIARLKEPNSRAARVFELTRNPLLLTTICLVHRDREGTLPDRRVRLYHECIKILLGNWREAKKLPNAVPSDQAQSILQPVALFMHDEEGRTQATAAELAPTIDAALGTLRHKMPTAEAFLRSIRDESGLLTGYGDDRYGFMHLGFQEYLAAQEIFTQGFDQHELLRKLASRFGESWWQEVTLLLLALDESSVFERFMRCVVEEPAFAEQDTFIAACLNDAARLSAEPFVELLARDPGTDETLWRRQEAALRVVRRVEPETAERMAEQLRRHPWPAVRRQFETEADAPAGEKVLAARGGYELVRISGGSFLLGSAEEEVERLVEELGTEWRDMLKGERPQQAVTLGEFQLGVLPVTNAEYERFMQANHRVKEPEYWGLGRFNAPRTTGGRYFVPRGASLLRLGGTRAADRGAMGVRLPSWNTNSILER